MPYESRGASRQYNLRSPSILSALTAYISVSILPAMARSFRHYYEQLVVSGIFAIYGSIYGARNSSSGGWNRSEISWHRRGTHRRSRTGRQEPRRSQWPALITTLPFGTIQFCTVHAARGDSGKQMKRRKWCTGRRQPTSRTESDPPWVAPGQLQRQRRCCYHEVPDVRTRRSRYVRECGVVGKWSGACTVRGTTS
jgi:hypothetical protein